MPLTGLAAAGVGAFGSLIGDIFNSSASSKAAKAQLQATRETNEMNYKIWQEQRQAEVDMWNMQNSYNDPSAQMERLRNAGLNPYMAMANASNSSGISSSAPSTGQAPTMQTADSSAFQLQAQGNPWYGLFQGLAHGAMNFGDTWSTITNAQTNKDVGISQIGLNNANRDFTLLNKSWAPKIWGSDVALKNSQTDLNITENKFQTETFQIRKDILNTSLAGMQLNNETQRIMNEYLPQEKQLGIMLQSQTLTNMIAQLDLTKAQTKETLAKVKVHITQSILNQANAGLANSQTQYYNTLNEGAKIDNNQKQLDYETASALAGDIVMTTLVENSVRRAALELERSKIELEQLRSDEYSKEINDPWSNAYWYEKFNRGGKHAYSIVGDALDALGANLIMGGTRDGMNAYGVYKMHNPAPRGRIGFR